MIGLYKSIALEVAKRNINVNIVSPGFIKTSMTDKLNENQKIIFSLKYQWINLEIQKMLLI